MTGIDRAIHLKSFGDAISPGAAGLARGTMHYPTDTEPGFLSDEYELAEMAAMSGVHVARMSLVLQFGKDVLLDIHGPDADPTSADIMLNVLRTDLLRAIRRVSDPVLARCLGTGADWFHEAARVAGLACARYLDAAVRYDVARIRIRSMDADRLKTNVLAPALAALYPAHGWTAAATSKSPVPERAYMERVLYRALFLTAGTPDGHELSDAVGTAIGRIVKADPFLPDTGFADIT